MLYIIYIYRDEVVMKKKEKKKRVFVEVNVILKENTLLKTA